MDHAKSSRRMRSWKVTGEGPIQEADLLMGEAYDARKAMPGWSSPGFDDSGLADCHSGCGQRQPGRNVLSAPQSNRARARRPKRG